MLDFFISPIWVNDEKNLQQILEYPLKREDKSICLTKCPEYASALARAKVPCIYLKTGQESTWVSGVDLIFETEESNPMLDEILLERTWQRHFHIPWQIAQTERLLIRESVMTDLPEFLKMYEEEKDNPDVIPMQEDPEEELEAYIRCRYPFYGYGLWSVVERSTGRVIGRAGFQEYQENDAQHKTAEVRTEIAYLFSKNDRRKGYAKEAVQAILNYGRQELELKEVYLRTSKENRASQSLAECLGFEKIGRGKYLLNL